MADVEQRKQAQILLTSTQYNRFKELQLKLSTETRQGTPQPAKGTVVIERLLSALEHEIEDTGA